MQVDNVIQEKSLKDSSKKQKITIANDYLQKLQQRFAFATILIPFIGSILAIGFFRLSDVGGVEIGLLVSMYALTMVGITVGFHRQFAHTAFRTNTPIRIILAILGSMAAQGPVIHWVSNHRRHHQYSDQPGDTHSPHVYEGKQFSQLRGLWYAHIGWMLNGEVTNSALFARELLQEPAIAKVNQLYLTWVILGLAIPAYLGGVMTATWIGALQGFLWGGLVRIFFAHHATWSINSITHLYGSRAFDTREHSTNNIWLVIPTAGEAWHNNHHAFPNSAKFGLQWWQIDLGYWIVRVLEVFGLAWDVKAPTAGMIEAKKPKAVKLAREETDFR
ncbi:acyl-CoA desaturase [Scytonema sp. NUACC26]|uniref:acyl-CoA desaturase n=1 Tax=Scytonema sp. NUACC26 TaxID=3140176 RepID=UPI0034DBEF3D